MSYNPPKNFSLQDCYDEGYKEAKDKINKNNPYDQIDDYNCWYEWETGFIDGVWDF